MILWAVASFPTLFLLFIVYDDLRKIHLVQKSLIASSSYGRLLESVTYTVNGPEGWDPIFFVALMDDDKTTKWWDRNVDNTKKVISAQNFEIVTRFERGEDIWEGLFNREAVDQWLSLL